MSDLVGEWQNQPGLGFGSKAKRQQPSVIKKTVVGKNPLRRCQRINMVATVGLIRIQDPASPISWLEIFIVSARL